ncbi:MAG: phenylalanyl-tRNA synthetase subunit beta [Parcubacteria group bacterium Gr01-1014_66]|nr:MAG: phenylalanyl-tRNA synthetase subunit beta [Parcubacteria group bacterium Gr01-1014_66]
MKFSYNWLKELTGISDSPQGLGEFLTARVFEVEGITQHGNDWILEVKILPNRMADASGHEGLMREIAWLKGASMRKREWKIKNQGNTKTEDILEVAVENPDDCPRYSARIITGVKITSSPAWLRERLETCGLQSINNIVDAANYMMLETGQPLHVFDYDKLKAGYSNYKTISVRRARKGEQIMALDDKIYALSPDILVIADEKEPCAIAGIKGGKDSGVTGDTRTIIIESANFAPILIRRARQILNLVTDASVRFEHGLDPNQTIHALNRVALLIQEGAGGTIYKGIVDAYAKPSLSRTIPFRISLANQLIGKTQTRAFYKNAFVRMGSRVKMRAPDILSITPPLYRLDLEIEEDLIEEAARLVGYDSILPKTPAFTLAGAEENEELIWTERARNFLAHAGFHESMFYAFTSEKELTTYGLDTYTAPPLLNPAHTAATHLIPRPLIKYISSLTENLRHTEEIKLFGIAKRFVLTENKKIEEHQDLILTIGTRGKSGINNFYILKGIIDELCESFGITDYWHDDAGVATKKEMWIFHPYRLAELKMGDQRLGRLGEIHPDIAARIKTRGLIVAAEIDWDILTRVAKEEFAYRPPDKYPSLLRDLAVIVPDTIRVSDVEKIITAAAGPLLADLDLFDYFQDDPLRQGEKKNLAFHLVLHADDRTLRDEEADLRMQEIRRALTDQGWECV